jgi:opacity protein-like surface antigen
MAFKSWTTAAVFALAFSAAGAAQAQLYFRGDLGASISTNANFGDNDPNNFLICGNAPCTVPGRFSDFGNTLVLDAGIGSRLSPNARIEAMVGYRGYELRAFDSGVPSTEFRANITSVNAMANAYYDFEGRGWKPYLGLGIGTAQNKIDSLRFDDGFSFFGSTPGGTHSNFAWSFMAGAGIPLSYETTLDFGYRYIDLGKVEIPAGGPVTVAGAVTPPPYGGATGNLRAHEFTIGVRF